MTNNHEAAEQAKHSSAVNEELKARLSGHSSLNVIHCPVEPSAMFKQTQHPTQADSNPRKHTHTDGGGRLPSLTTCKYRHNEDLNRSAQHVPQRDALTSRLQCVV